MEEEKRAEIIKIDPQKETVPAKTETGTAKTDSHGGCCGPAENTGKMEHVETDKTDEHGGCCGSGIEVRGRKIGTKSVLIGGGVVVLGLLFLTGKGGAILGALPFLLILACPLMHVFMHGGKGHQH